MTGVVLSTSRSELVPVVWSDRAPRCILTIFSAVTILGVVPSLVPGINVNVLPPVSLVNLGMCRPPRRVRSPRAQLDAQSAGCGLLRCRLVRRRSASAARSAHHSRCPRSDPPRTHDAPLSCSEIPTLLSLAGLSFSCSGFPPFYWPAVLSCIALRRAPHRLHARTFASPRTDDRRTNEGSHPFLGRPFFLAPHCAARHTARMHARFLARARTTDERTMRRAVRRRG